MSTQPQNYWLAHREKALKEGRGWDAFGYLIQADKADAAARLDRLGFGKTSKAERDAMLTDLLEKAHPAQRAALLRKSAKRRQAHLVEMAGLPPIMAHGKIIAG